MSWGTRWGVAYVNRDLKVIVMVSFCWPQDVPGLQNVAGLQNVQSGACALTDCAYVR